MKTRIATTTHDAGIAKDIAEEMTEMLGTEFRVQHITGLPSGDFYRIDGEITAEQFEQMGDIKNEWLFVNPSKEWVAKFEE